MGERSSLDVGRDDIVDRFMGIPGLGRSRAEAIYDAGYTNLGLLRKASVEELTRVPGVGVSLARCISNNIMMVKEELPGEVKVSAPGAPELPSSKEEAGKTRAGAASPPAPQDGTGAQGASTAAAAGQSVPAQASGGQSRGFLSSLFGKILGKPGEKGPQTAQPEKKEEAKPEIKPAQPDVKVDGKPAETDVKIEGKPADTEVMVEGKPAKTGAGADGKPAEAGVSVEGKPETPKAGSGADSSPPEPAKAEEAK
jgi:hypothetical protein